MRLKCWTQAVFRMADSKKPAATLPVRRLPHPWPFPVSVVAGVIVRNVAVKRRPDLSKIEDAML
jgi:hypothetical protein